MSRQPQDREDLLREATALVERIELVVPGYEPPIVVGFRRDSSASFYFGPDPVYQFNSRGELRRGYWRDRLVKADSQRLWLMERSSDRGQTVLKTREMNAAESSEFIGLAERDLGALRQAIDAQEIRVLGQVPPEVELLPRIQEWLARHGSSITIARAPHAR